jgi:small-conductance mechanosensitive channel
MTAEKIEEQIIRIKQQVARLEQQVGDAKRNRDHLNQKHVDEKKHIEAQSQYLRQILENIAKLSGKLKNLPEEEQAQRKNLTHKKHLAEQQYKLEEEAKLKPLHDEYALTGDKLLDAKSKYEELALELAREKTVLEQKNHEAQQLTDEQASDAGRVLAMAQRKNSQTRPQHVPVAEVQKNLDLVKPLPPYAN